MKHRKRGSRHLIDIYDGYRLHLSMRASFQKVISLDNYCYEIISGRGGRDNKGWGSHFSFRTSSEIEESSGTGCGDGRGYGESGWKVIINRL